MHTRRRYIAIEDVHPGMTLASPAFAVEHGLLGLQFPIGLVLTQDSIDQLHAHRAEFVEVEEPDPRTDAEIEMERAQIAADVQRIFRGANVEEPHMAALKAQVLAYRSPT